MATLSEAGSGLGALSVKVTRRWVLWHGVFPVWIGGIIYLIFRSKGLVMFRWLEWAGLDALLEPLRRGSAPIRPWVPDFVVFTMPHCLWSYALTVNVWGIWREVPRQALLFSVTVGLTSGPLVELGQGLGWVPGTFDWMDLAGYIVAVAAASMSAFALTRRVSLCGL